VADAKLMLDKTARRRPRKWHPHKHQQMVRKSRVKPPIERDGSVEERKTFHSKKPLNSFAYLMFQTAPESRRGRRWRK